MKIFYGTFNFAKLTIPCFKIQWIIKIFLFKFLILQLEIESRLAIKKDKVGIMIASHESSQ